ncbi:MAG: RdgB/HAM1 family non-canonical purine NTP pyrophosphatase [Actinobacteria bacterium]|nr:RdgB/HAM1 family non-canonical purine NTP pyrophosphatase [Actinomycetota bacterium]MBT5502496.1 RdgB/HAM1 family non-canonical purine NTP pyrophosphatase [Actinomycetota bacterium]MBT5805699.1 RdgB/HAM1 family non-canonical purine NTP pyrophosphatase [Actinomycetota bacterium]MDA9017038.1 RdgB/HAM1 family non-canonical purine NTP pyrophosphatase [Actinomycetota bacterium]MDB0039453.1 RdgB/HAM1 family non-canonical purine NTP pyrophosphatase [Actinomycetota bacterium]
MTQKLVIASRNNHKIEEMRRILEQGGLDIELVGTAKFPNLPDVEETGATFAANALLKARAVSEFTGLPTVGDDSGLCVDALNGMPGILSARWSGTHGNDRANLELILAQISQVPIDRRGASFVCAAAYVHPDGTEFVVEGQMPGTLIDAPRGENGFGYDPIFVPHGHKVTSAEMTSELKDSISHRGKALASLTIALKA